MPTVVVNKIALYYEVSGSGPSIVYIHGWGDSLRTFDGIVSKLSQEYTCIRLDLPGFGRSQVPNEVWGLDEYAKCVEDFLEKIQKKADVIIGHSNGGALAIRGLATGVLTSKVLILLAPAGIRDRQKTKRVVIKAIAKTGKVVTAPLPHSIKQRLRTTLYGTVGSDMLVAPQLQETFKKTVRQDVQADARTITVATLLLYGTNDTATPPLYGELYKQLIPNATLHLVPGAGHFVHHDAEDMIIEEISKYVAEHV